MDFPLLGRGSSFTDDTVLTIATARAILSGEPYGHAYLELGRRYPRAGYGKRFREWLAYDETRPYGSFGNGSAMRVSPVGLAFDTVPEALIAFLEAASTEDAIRLAVSLGGDADTLAAIVGSSALCAARVASGPRCPRPKSKL